MVSKIDHLYGMLDDLDDDLSAMQEDLEVAIELLKEGDSKKAIIILEEMSAFLVDFLEPEECDDEECGCSIVEEIEVKPAPKKAEPVKKAAPKKAPPKKAAKKPAKKPAKKK